MLVFGRVHIASKFVGGEPQLRFEADVRGGVLEESWIPTAIESAEDSRNLAM